HAVLAAKRDHRATACATQSRLVGAGLVVDAGVDHAGVAAALVRADRRLLLQYDDRLLGMGTQDCARGCQSDDSATDDNDVRPLHRATLGADASRRRISPDAAGPYGAALFRSNNCTINACCALASAEPLPPRPVARVASFSGVEPDLFVRVESAPPSISARTAAPQRVRTAHQLHQGRLGGGHRAPTVPTVRRSTDADG